uniref:Putative carboxymethyl cellulase n=1 Tax=uncultured prokaryote TaxID=198431 RepID=A0A165FZZ0_9ZZZZ|nr:putative carboxymethyl cellulase [uncultured prokaryote]
MPQAFHHDGVTYFGTVRGDTGAQQLGQYVHATDALTLSTVHTFSPDMHNYPAVVRRADGHLVTVYCDHSAGALYRRISTSPDDATAWGSETNIDSQVGGVGYTYPWLMRLDEEDDDLLLFIRNYAGGTMDWCLSRSTDGGSSWSAFTTLVSGSRYYARCWLSPDGRIDFATTDGSYAEDGASLYHFYSLPDGTFHQSDGTVITSPPFTPGELTKVYDGEVGAGVRYPASVARDVDSGDVVIAFPIQTGSPTDHVGEDEDYLYARWDGSGWTVNTVATDVGANTFEITEGSLSVDPHDLAVLLVSKRVAGTWTVHRYVTGDEGVTWDITAIGAGAGGSLYPGWVQDHADGLLAMWMQGTFTTEDDWSSGIAGYRRV